MNELSARALQRLSSAAAIAIFSILVATPRANSQTPTDTPTETPTASGSTTPTASATQTPTAVPTETEIPAPAPTTAPAETPTPRPTVAPTPFVGGSAGATSIADDFGIGGETVDAGKFQVTNTTEETERITRVAIQASDPEVVSSLSLTAKSSGASQTVTVAPPSTDNVFVFDAGFEIPAGETATFSLSGTIASQGGQTTSEATPTPGAGATETPEPTATQTPDPFALSRAGTVHVVLAASIPLREDPKGRSSLGSFAAIFMLLAMAAASRTDRRGLSATLFLLAIAALLWMNLLPGCGAEQPTQQTVGRIRGETDSGPVVFSGVPFSLGTVSRPQNLVFPGAPGSNTTPTPLL